MRLPRREVNMSRASFALIVLLAPSALLGGCFIPEGGPWKGSVSNLVGGPCEDDPYDPGEIISFTVSDHSQDGFDLATDEYTAWCSLNGKAFTCDPAEWQVAGDAADATILRTFRYSGDFTTADDMHGKVEFESVCTGAGCTVTEPCAVTWKFKAQESS
jgi:hypothetical protein